MSKLRLTFGALGLVVATILFVASPLTDGAEAETQPTTTTTTAIATTTTTTVPVKLTYIDGKWYTPAQVAQIKAFAKAYQAHLVKVWVARVNFNKWMAWALAKERAAAAAAAAAYPRGLCGGDLPPCYVMMRESRGNITAQNPRSTASGKWQFLDSTWAGYGGYAKARYAPEKVQDARARQLWAGGRGCGHWAACG